MNKAFKILPFFALAFSQLAFAQIKEEKLILARKREPEVKRIEKKKSSVAVVKNYPPESKKVEDSLNLKYEITDVPAVSDFKSSKIEGSDVSPQLGSRYQKNYARFGMGNYGKILGDANISGAIDEKTVVGADVHVLSTTGLKKEFPWNSGATNAEAAAFMNHFGDVGKLNITAGYRLDDYNLYGIYALQPAENIDLKQRVNQLNINGFYDFYENNYLDYASIKTGFLGDHFGSKENTVSAKLGLAKDEIATFSGITMNASLGFAFDSQRTDFELLNQNSLRLVNAAASPKVTFFKGKSYLMLGSDFAFLGRTNSAKAMDDSRKDKNYWFPRAEFQFYWNDAFKFYAGVKGGLERNTYSSLLSDNPYLSPDQLIKPTETKYHAYFGLRGDLNQNFKYDVNAGFGKVNDAVFFAHNDLFDHLGTLNRSAYNFANTFSALYDSGTVTAFEGSAEYFPLQNLSIEAGLKFTQYTLDNLDNVYGTTKLKGTIGAKYSLLNEKLLLGAKAVFSDGNKVQTYAISQNPINSSLLISTPQTTSVSGYADINLSAEYKIHKNFSIFALGNNLLNARYQSYYGYKRLGAQVTGGVKFSF